MSNTKLLLLINLVFFFIGLDLVLYKKMPDRPSMVQPIPHAPIVQPIEEPEPEPINYDITNPVPSYLAYSALVDQLKQWEQEAPELVEVGTYGKSSQGQDIYYIRIRNTRTDEGQSVVLLTAAIHGNEPWSTTTMMACVGTLLDRYGDDEKITALVDGRDLYVIPVVSPDAYPYSRHVDGVDPNRNFPTQTSPEKISVPPIQALRDFYFGIRPVAVISGHTFGRVYLYPWGDSRRPCPNAEDYHRILGQMEALSRYGSKQAGFNYGTPIFGTEVDWYYRQGSFSLVMEIGTHQRPPSMEEVRSEFERTFGAVMYFIEEAPKVEVQSYAVADWRAAA